MGTGTRTSADAVVSLRKAEPTDVEAMHDIEQLSFSDPWSRYSLLAAVDSPGLLVTVACAGAGPRQNLLGYSILARAADECELLNLAVAEQARRMGVGGALLQRALGDAERLEARAIFLEVRASNEAARRLYQRAGFEEIGRRPAYYRKPMEDALILRRVVSD